MALQDEEEEKEEMDLGELNLDELEKAVEYPVKGIIPAQQVVLLKEAIINTKRFKKRKILGVIPDSLLRPGNSQVAIVRDSPQSAFPTSLLTVWYRESVRFVVRLP